MGGYRTLVVDPPWPQASGGPLTGRRGFVDAYGASLPMPYRTMSIDEIKGFPIDRWAHRNAHLYLWTTNRFLSDAFAVIDAWGFKYSTTLVWVKKPIGGGLGGAYGIAVEYVLFVRRGQLPTRTKINRNWFDWKRPYENGAPKHSAKPPEFFDLVRTVSPAPRIELFARCRRAGWSAWGDEVPAA